LLPDGTLLAVDEKELTFRSFVQELPLSAIMILSSRNELEINQTNRLNGLCVLVSGEIVVASSQSNTLLER
jgi:hypothetical protein